MLTPNEIQELSLALAELKAEAEEVTARVHVAYWSGNSTPCGAKYFQDRRAALVLAAARIEGVLKSAREVEASHNAAIPAALAEIGAADGE